MNIHDMNIHDIYLPPDIERGIREFTLAMDSETYTEYLMKRVLDGMEEDDKDEGPMYENEEEFKKVRRYMNSVMSQKVSPSPMSSS